MASAKRELPKIIIIQHQGAEPDLGVRYGFVVRACNWGADASFT
jgi:hypothetical protein